MVALSMMAFSVINLSAQESIIVNGKTLSGTVVKPGYWLFQDQQDTIIAMTLEEFSRINTELSRHELTITWKDSIIAAQQRELEAYRDYEANANKLIGTQHQMITKADSLYTGYKQLYKDLEKLSDLKSLSLVGGSGFYWLEQTDATYIFNLGLEYRHVQVSYEFGGNGYKGFSMQYRVPLF